MKRAMISQPMNGLSEQEIIDTKERANAELAARGYEVINTLFEGEWFSNKAMEERGVVSKRLCFLAKSLDAMSMCNAVYFCKDWYKNSGCRIEHEAAKAYRLECIYEEAL